MKSLNVSILRDFFTRHSELQILLALVDNDPADYWLVGGCLRNFILNSAHTDIDIASSSDPTLLAKSWASQTGGVWFWLDEQRMQSRVVLPNSLILDFTPLRAESIEEDQILRDFTINSLALKLDASFPESPLLDPLNGIEHLGKKQLHVCSVQSFSDDPLRILKGIRHAVSLNFSFEEKTWHQMCFNSHLLSRISGERIRDELAKIFSSESVVRGVQLLDESGVLRFLLGAPGSQWNCQRVTAQLAQLNDTLNSISAPDVPDLKAVEQFNPREIILFAELLKEYAPADCSDVLHNRLRLSRRLKRILLELGTDRDSAQLGLLLTAGGPRQQALLVEQLNPFAAFKLLYWGVCGEKFDFGRLKELIHSFNMLKCHDCVPDLLTGKQIMVTFPHVSPRQIGVWQSRIKLAEINREIFSSDDAEKWLKDKLLFDNEEV